MKEYNRRYWNIGKERQTTPRTRKESGGDIGINTERREYGKFFRGGRLTAYHVTPEGVEPGSKPIIVLPGFVGSSSKRALVPFSEHLARTSGREVWMLTHRGYRRWEKGMQTRRLQPPRGSAGESWTTRVPSIDVQKGNDLEWFFDREGIDQADIVSHSMAIGMVSNFLADHPEKVPNVFTLGATLNRPEGVPKLAVEFAPPIVKEAFVTPVKKPKSLPAVLGYAVGSTGVFAASHLIRAAREVKAIARADYGRVVSRYRERETSPNIYNAYGEYDSTFRTQAEKQGLVDETFPKGGHNAPIYLARDTAEKVTKISRKTGRTR